MLFQTYMLFIYLYMPLFSEKHQKGLKRHEIIIKISPVYYHCFAIFKKKHFVIEFCFGQLTANNPKEDLKYM